MRKVLLASAILLTSFVAKQAGAQTLPAGIVVINDGFAGTTLDNVVLTVVSSQSQAFGQPVSTLNNNFNEGLNVQPDQEELLGAAAYWVNPTVLTPLTLNIASGAFDALVTNRTGATAHYWIVVSMTNENGDVVSSTGSTVTIANGQQADVPIPALANTYDATTYLQANPTYGIPTPISIALLQD